MPSISPAVAPPGSIPAAKPLFSYRKHWAHRFGVVPFFPTSRPEMEVLGWDSCDVVLVTGDAYIDHPSFGMALIARLLEAQGFRVGIIAQPAWQDDSDFKALGQPNLAHLERQYFGDAGAGIEQQQEQQMISLSGPRVIGSSQDGFDFLATEEADEPLHMSFERDAQDAWQRRRQFRAEPVAQPHQRRDLGDDQQGQEP